MPITGYGDNMKMSIDDKVMYGIIITVAALAICFIVTMYIGINKSHAHGHTKIDEITCKNPITGNTDTYKSASMRFSYKNPDADIFLNSNVWIIKTVKYTLIYPVQNCVFRKSN